MVRGIRRNTATFHPTVNGCKVEMQLEKELVKLSALEDLSWI